MKLARYGRAGKEKPALVDRAGKLRDLSEVIEDIDADTLAPRALARLAKVKPESLPAVRGAPRIGPCLRRVGNFIAVGLNYADHAAESGMPVPKEPVLFTKAPNCVVGPNDDVVIPKGSVKTDWEVELAIVIGSRASYVSEDRRSPMSPAIASATTCRSANSSSNVPASGSRARAPPLSARSGRGW